jgi:hypothetical protein
MRSRLPLVCAILFVCIFADVSVYAQQVDLGATWTRYFKFFEAGNYPAALEEAQKYEAAAKVRFGTGNANYAAQPRG